MDMPERIYCDEYLQATESRSFGDQTEYVREDIARKEADALIELLEDENSLFAAMLLDKRAGEEIEEQITANRTAIRSYRAQHNATPQTKGRNELTAEELAKMIEALPVCYANGPKTKLVLTLPIENCTPEIKVEP